MGLYGIIWDDCHGDITGKPSIHGLIDREEHRDDMGMILGMMGTNYY